MRLRREVGDLHVAPRDEEACDVDVGCGALKAGGLDVRAHVNASPTTGMPPRRYGDAASLPTRRSPVAPLHVGGGRGLINEHNVVGIKIELALEPSLACLAHVRTVLLGRVKRPFLRVMPRRRKKRDRPLRLTAAPCSCNVSRTSRR